MSIQEQIQLDVDAISENSLLQSQLFDFLKLLKATLPVRGNVGMVLSHAGNLDDASAKEITRLINEEFGKIDNE